jgi:monofunctional glycosyltransferase
MLPPAEATPARPPPPEHLPEPAAKAPDAVSRRLTIVTPAAPRARPEPTQLRSAPAPRPEPEPPPPSPVPRAALGPAAAPTSTPEAAAEPLLRPLPVPVFQPVPPREPAAAAFPVWQEAPARRPPRWTPADGFGPELGTIFKRAVKWSALAGLGLLLGLATLIVLYRWVNPPTSMLMLGQRLGGTTITRHWQPLEHISSNLQLAVIVSEDGRFCRHRGVDWEELESAIDQSVDGIARGGSTIAMQTVKNLFLWPAKSYLRKAIEIPLAYAVDAAWGKRRLLEIYLNIAEWGPGVFGAEAAARYHFRKPAALLTAREAALLAVSLPNPFERRAGAPGPGTQRLAANLMLRMRAAPGMARCVRSGSGL